MSESLRKAVENYLIDTGPCEKAVEGEGLCEDPDCSYCNMERVLMKENKLLMKKETEVSLQKGPAVYEIVNPSDEITIVAADELIAQYVAIIGGEGAYGLKNKEGTSYPTLILYCSKGKSEEILSDIFGSIDKFHSFPSGQMTQIADAFESAAVVGFHERKNYDDDLMASSDKHKFKLKWDDRHRTSMYRIAEAFWGIGEQYRKMIDVKKEDQEKNG